MDNEQNCHILFLSANVLFGCYVGVAREVLEVTIVELKCQGYGQSRTLFIKLLLQGYVKKKLDWNEDGFIDQSLFSTFSDDRATYMANFGWIWKLDEYL